MIEFRFLRLDEYPIVANFLDKHWQKDHIYCRERKLFDWTFHRSSHWKEPTYSFAVALHDEECIGILGAIPMSFNQLGETLKGVWLANWMVSEEYRNTTASIQLINMFRKMKLDAIISFGITQQAKRFYKVFNWTILDGIPRFIGLFEQTQVQNIELLLRANPEWTKKRATQLVEELTITKELTTSDLKEVEGREAIDNWDKVGWEHFKKDVVGAARDEEYLRWRYLEHPLFSYHVITQSDGKKLGLAVWRTETIHVLDGEVKKPLYKIGRLVEFLPTSESNAKQLLQRAVSGLSEEGAIGFDWYNYHGAIGAFLQTLGIKAAQDVICGGEFPTRFNPLSGGGGNINSAVFAPLPAPQVALDKTCMWYWTKSDSDQDRPN